MFEPRLALASLSGRSDAEWAEAAESIAGAAVLGGIALDDPTREAARALVARDREEFLPADPHAFLDRELAALADAPLRPAFNVRAASPEPLTTAAATCARHDAILEVNAHCRQDEMCEAGAGQSLLHDPDRLVDQVRAARGTGATVSLKCRTEVPGVDLPAVCSRAHDAGQDESCGQCTPCREGTGWLENLVTRIDEGEGSMRDLDLLLDLCDQMEGRTICAFADAATWPVRYTVQRFREDFEAKCKPSVHPVSGEVSAGADAAVAATE